MFFELELTGDTDEVVAKSRVVFETDTTDDALNYMHEQFENGVFAHFDRLRIVLWRIDIPFIYADGTRREPVDTMFVHELQTN